MNNETENSLYFDDYFLSDENGNPFDVTARYFYLPNMFNSSSDKKFEILDEDNLGIFATERDDDLKDLLTKV